MQFNMHSQVGARFKLIAHKGDGVPTKETDWFHNIVLDTGLAQMSVGTWIDRCCVGTGNSIPIPSQTNLDNIIAQTTNRPSQSGFLNLSAEPYYYGAKAKWSFGQGVAAGNISEVGLSWAWNSLWNRALIRDSNGNPTTITVLADEYLDVISEIRIYPPSKNTGSFNLIGKNGQIISTHAFNVRPLLLSNPEFKTNSPVVIGSATSSGSNNNNITIYDGNFVGIAALPSGSASVLSGNTTKYPTQTKASTIVSIGLNEGNLSHKSITCPCSIIGTTSDMIGYQVQIDPTITKTSAQTMTYTFEMSWGRYEGT